MGIWEKTKSFQVPTGDKLALVLCGIINFIAPGIGTLVMGVINSDSDDMVIGLLQLLFTLLIFGYIWSLVWGVLMIVAACK